MSNQLTSYNNGKVEQGRCVGINMHKVHFMQQEARRQGKRVYRVDIDFKNAFNTMSQAALWQVMKMFKIPDVDDDDCFYYFKKQFSTLD